MSFADQLRQNYQPAAASTEASRERQTALGLAGTIVYCVRQQCQKISRQARSLEGYYCFNYDEHYIGKDYPVVILPTEHAEGVKPLIDHFDHYYRAASWLSRGSVDLLVATVRSELGKLGFRSLTVRAENVQTRVTVGYTEFLKRNKYREVPAWRIFVSVTW